MSLSFNKTLQPLLKRCTLTLTPALAHRKQKAPPQVILARRFPESRQREGKTYLASDTSIFRLAE